MKRFLVALTAIMLLFVVIGCNADPETPQKKLPFEKKYECSSFFPNDCLTYGAKTGDFHYYLYWNTNSLYLFAFNDKDGKEAYEEREPFMAKRIVLNSDFEEYKHTQMTRMQFITREGYYGDKSNIFCIEGTYDMLSEEKEYRSEFAGWTAFLFPREVVECPNGLATSLYLLNYEDNIEGKVNFNVPEEYRSGEKNLISTLAAMGEWEGDTLPKMSDETKNRIFRY